MKKYSFLGLLLTFSLLFWGMTSSLSFAGEGKVKINSPENEATVEGSTIVTEFEIVDKGERGDHVHLYLDGDFQGAIFINKYKLKDLPKGKHTLEIKLASKGHKELGPKDKVEFTVK